MEKITTKQARDSLKKYLVRKAAEKAETLEIRDTTNEAIYLPREPGGYYFVHVPEDNISHIGAGRMIVISKTTGDIIFDGMVGE